MELVVLADSKSAALVRMGSSPILPTILFLRSVVVAHHALDLIGEVRIPTEKIEMQLTIFVKIISHFLEGASYEETRFPLTF